MFRWIGKQLELGRRDAQLDTWRSELMEYIMKNAQQEKGLQYNDLLRRYIHQFTKHEIDEVMYNLIDAKLIRREGTLMRAGN